MKPMFLLAATMLAVPALAQDAAPMALPMCSAKVQDKCQQTPAQQARAMSGAQADARDMRNEGHWTPNGKVAAGTPGGYREMLRGRLAAADTNHDGVLSKDEWIASGHKVEVFDALDTDHDGNVTKAELRAASAEIKSAIDDIRDALADADTNKDGKWSKEEWTSAGMSDEAFAHFDKNKDGFVSKAELRGGIKKAVHKAHASKAKTVTTTTTETPK